MEIAAEKVKVELLRLQQSYNKIEISGPVNGQCISSHISKSKNNATHMGDYRPKVGEGPKALSGIVPKSTFPHLRKT